MQSIITRELLNSEGFQANTPPDNGTKSTPTIPGDQNDGGGSTQIIGISAALGSGYGAHLALQAGPITGGTAIATLGAAAAGLTAAGVLGWEAGALIGKIPAVKEYVDYATSITLGGSNIPEGMEKFYKMGPYPEGGWVFDAGLGPQVETKEVWWYVPELGDRVAGTGNTAYRDPGEAIEHALSDYNGDAGGGDMIALLGVYHDATLAPFAPSSFVFMP